MRETRRQSRKRTGRILMRVTTLPLQMNTITMRMEPAQEQEREILRMEQIVRIAKGEDKEDE